MSDVFFDLSAEVRELSVPSCVERIGKVPDPIVFLREYVAQNRPVVITGGASHWPALERWNLSFLQKKLDGQKVTVDVTPDGRGDAVVQTDKGTFFVTPEERQMSLEEFERLLKQSRVDPSLGVPYAQHQNGSFTEEYDSLIGDAEPHLEWASEALGGLPEAVNMWIGDERAVTSLHRDHYENLYVVVKGAKHFTLLPPADYHRLYTTNYPTASYVQKQEGGEFEVIPQDPPQEVPWIPVDPHPFEPAVARRQYPRFFDGPPPVECTVHEGDILYLPSMWYHHVRQTPNEEGVTIAVNYWYDMAFDCKYAYFNFVQACYDSKGAVDSSGATPAE
uniref:JmjC domain-containing protein n=1 Tax=Pyramimonas obovata TaxID=1411642 RepID=A0A7S0RY55_9CHLO|mmetsp:Transcript_9045/g.18729  ORF Transcript_9045/g.18729 Transcript_9045/m.18729 type:complete len:334 (+) Transcript_9045:185-1186(+)|eukprot:CAMPEP_0118923628 /NCGR_PEP_ID=MMETSP1169-20130426/2078_1 /TAXON_ID=36882 /ORGANISM="Pyramimonas obovata, Strain CCMP722" /LENGTH=333 /DNA_ID=CAMNT_0006864641 /DNA_START=140 /DNA_END=1141 /DNA_ORIENTATION=+